MPCFVCKKCGCIENTALGHYWMRKRVDAFIWPEELGKYKGEALCSECAPTDFSDGSGKNGNGKWHGRFDKEHWSTRFDKEPEGTF